MSGGKAYRARVFQAEGMAYADRRKWDGYLAHVKLEEVFCCIAC